MSKQSGKWKAESRTAVLLRNTRPSVYPPSPFRQPRRAVTLIELLITITIIATLSAAFLGASRSAMETARAARTKSTITKIHGLLMERWASYATRRVDINTTAQNAIDAIPPGPDRGKALADARLIATRELMKFEMPDRWTDVLEAAPLAPSTVFLANPPALARTYYRRYQQSLTVTNNDNATVLDNGSAECLYLTVMLATGDGEARTLFSPQDIGDIDGDGAPEFLDGWGTPIRWVRWPAGFLARSSLMTGDPDADHDPFDPFRRHSPNATPTAGFFPSGLQPYLQRLRDPGDPTIGPPGFRLVPLIFSSGPDGIGDISTRTGSITSPTATKLVLLDPYAIDTTFNVHEFGSFGDNPVALNGEDNSIDNIHNHLQDGR